MTENIQEWIEKYSCLQIATIRIEDQIKFDNIFNLLCESYEYPHTPINSWQRALQCRKAAPGGKIRTQTAL